MPTEKIIGIMGIPVNSGNRGVLALGAPSINLCAHATRGGQAALLLNHIDNQPARFRAADVPRDIRVVNCRLSPRSRPSEHLAFIVLMAALYGCLPFGGLRKRIAGITPWIRAMEECEIVGDVRCGDSFSDIGGMKRFLLGSLAAWTVVLVMWGMLGYGAISADVRSLQVALGTDYRRHWMHSGVTLSLDHTDIINYYIQMGIWGGALLPVIYLGILWHPVSQFPLGGGHHPGFTHDGWQ